MNGISNKFNDISSAILSVMLSVLVRVTFLKINEINK